jgi:hypothetical protein
LRLFSQEFCHRSSTLVTAMPLEQLAEKIPSLSLLLLFRRFDEDIIATPFSEKK